MAGSFLNSQYREVRPAKAEQLPDGRKRLTRFVSFKQNSEFPTEMGGTVPTTTDAATNWASPPTGWENLYLISAQTDTSLSPNGSGNNPVTILTFESAGTISQTDETRNNSALLIRTIRTAHTAPATPGGYTLIRIDDDNPSGFDTFTYTFALGTGQVGQDDSIKNNGALLIRTIRYLTVPGTLGTKGDNPIGTPGGYTLIDESYAEQDGHRLWTGTYAKGTGQISREDDTRNNGKLLLATITHLTVPGAADPVATLFGYVRVSVSNQESDGHEVWRATFAQGDGEIGRLVDRSQCGTTEDGTVGIERLNIEYLTAPAAAEPTWSSVTGYVKMSVRKAERDGHMIWTGGFAKGAGLVVDDYTIRSLGKMIVYHRVALGAAPTAPAGSLTGTVTLFDVNVRQDSGYAVYDYRWVEVEIDGQTSLGTAMRPDGSLVYSVVELNDAADTPAYPGSGTGYLVDLNQRLDDGHYVNSATYIKAPATVTLNKVVQFQMPGTAVFTTSPDELAISPPSTRTLLAAVEISYGTTQLSDTPFKVDYGCFYRATYVRTGSSVGEYISKSLGYVVGNSDSVTGTAATFNGVLCDSYDAVLSSSSPTARPTGATVLDVDNDIYLTAIDGTVVYRRTKTSYTF